MKNPWFQASAPGRMDVMGGIADYSGSLVLQMPIRAFTEVRVRLRTDFMCNVVSSVDHLLLTATIAYRDLLNNGKVDLEKAKIFFKNRPADHWSSYVIGCALLLQAEKGIDFRGADFEIISKVPLGKGVSSSASIEVATMKALQLAFGLSFQGTELPRLAQKVENLIVGAPCGLMDQLATYFGMTGKLLPIICQPDVLLPLVEIPEPIHFVGIDSGVRHSVGGMSYGDVRCAAFMGYTIIARELGATEEDILNARLGKAAQLPFNGYLCNISVKEFETRFRSLLPERMTGKEFVQRFRTTVDGVTDVDPSRAYAVLRCTSHPVYENERVREFMELLQNTNPSSITPTATRRLGELMHHSHESYSACGLGSERTDEIVSLLRNCPSVAGSKITGGGSGGTVCALAIGSTGVEEVLDLHERLSNKYKAKLAVFK